MKIQLFLLPLLLLLITATPATALLKAGDPAPDFSARTLDDKPIKLSNLKGKALLVEMGTTWCPACNEQAHQIDGMRDFLRSKEITYVSVFLADSADSIRDHLKEEGLKSPDQILIDSGEARRNYGIFSIPRLVLIDKDFNVVFDAMVLSAKEIQKRIEEHLGTP